MKNAISLNIVPRSLVLKKGLTFTGAMVEFLPVDADDCALNWSSDNMTVASVDSCGNITAKSVGTAHIKAVNPSSGIYDSITVSVVSATYETTVSGITMNNYSLNMSVGDQSDLDVSICPCEAIDKTLNWYSSNTEVATVNSSGTVTAIGQGSSKIVAYATDGSGVYEFCNVTVTGATAVSSIDVILPSCSICKNGSLFASALVLPTNATVKGVEWHSSNECVAFINPISGLITAQGAGETTIYANAKDGSGVCGCCQLTVLDDIDVCNIELNKSTLKLDKGDTYQLHATICPSNATNQGIMWKSTRTNIASVDPDTGLITAKSAGEAKIAAISKDNTDIRAFCTVYVKQTSTKPTLELPLNKVRESSVSAPVDVSTGAHAFSNVIMSLFGGQGIKLVAHYNSTQLVSGLFGYGWWHNYEKHVVIDGNKALVYSSPTVYTEYEAQSDCLTTYACTSANKSGYFLTVDHSAQYPYSIDCNSSYTEHYNSNGMLAKITDHHGFDTVISYTDTLITITDTVSGKSLYLEKDCNCHVSRVYDDTGRQTTFTYSGNNLVQIKDTNGNVLTYSYDEEGRIKSGVDGNGTRYFENTYDTCGRISAQKDSITDSESSTFTYEDCIRVTTDRIGNCSTREYDCNGLLVSHTDEDCNTTTYEYDSHYNVTKETDPKGNSTIKEYNSFNKPTKIIDKNGNVTTMCYDAKGNLTNIRYPAINGTIPEESFVYNSRNQLTKHTDVRGTVTVYTYDTNGLPKTKKVGNRNPITFCYENGMLSSLTDAMGNTTRYVYNAEGQVIKKTDADNNVTQYVYDKLGNLLKTIDANGKTITYTYDCNGQRTSITDANGNKTEYAYNGNMKNDLITLPDGNTIRYKYDFEDRLIKVADQADNVTIIRYDKSGKIASKRFADSGIVSYEYDSVGNVIKESNPKGAVTTKTYDKLGNVLTVTDNEGNVTSYEYNAMSKPIKVTNAVAGTVIYEYSASGDLLSETDALGNTKTYTYDAYGNVLTVTDAKNNVTTYTYDQNNNLITVTDALGNVTTYTYNCLNQCTSVKNALNHVVSYGYDALGRRTTITDARGNVFTTTYDGNGNVIKTTDAKGNTISQTVYNSLNKPLTVTDAMGKVTAYTYDERGNVESVTDSMNHRTEFTYNSRGQNTSVLDAANNTSTARYDLLGNVTKLTGPLGGTTNYTYDDMGRLISESTVSGGSKSYEYNELNVRKKITNARGQIRQIFYDAMGRITGYTSPEGTVSYTYDANGNVLTVTDSHGTVRRTYDALNRVSSYTDTYGNVIRYEYDAIGNLTKITYPDNTSVRYEYDSNRNLKKVIDWANRVTTYAHDENNRVIRVVKPDGSITTTVYDNMQRVTSTVEKTASGAIISGFEYTYDSLSRIAEEKVLDKNIKFCYTYDNLGRVTKRVTRDLCDSSIISTESFTYDAAGNITDAPDSCFAYDVNNRLTTFNGNDVSYDLDGNMLSNGSLSCSYDSANRLVSAGGHTYTYNAEDVRIRNLCCDADTVYVYDTNSKLSKLLCKTTNGITTKYVYGKGLIGEEKCGNFKTYHFDCRGSTIAITDMCGNITDTFAYDTYGKLISRTGSSFVIFGYNGRDGVVTDKNGLIYMRARYYSPDMKRFVNADIVAGEISNAITLNRFAYANGNPVSLTDPFGLRAVSKEMYNSENEDIRIKDRINLILSQYHFGQDLKSFLLNILDILEGCSLALSYENHIMISPHEKLFVKVTPTIGKGTLTIDMFDIPSLFDASNNMLDTMGNLWDMLPNVNSLLPHREKHLINDFFTIDPFKQTITTGYRASISNGENELAVEVGIETQIENNNKLYKQFDTVLSDDYEVEPNKAKKHIKIPGTESPCQSNFGYSPVFDVYDSYCSSRSLNAIGAGIAAYSFAKAVYNLIGGGGMPSRVRENTRSNSMDILQPVFGY